QDNHNYEGCLSEVAKANPDVLLLIEVNSGWEKGTSTLNEEYPFSIKIPLENTYGMLLYSKFELKEDSIFYMVK
ncbi:endonuclease/exonuclease/phosphatase family protein, partial [Parabacteroides distasonis]|uniref:endonuclease/exonuclease/phosphatase family protein n=1 Tax=Parabacteroides distasonis TaxID=823 RepID=UPI001D0760F4